MDGGMNSITTAYAIDVTPVICSLRFTDGTIAFISALDNITSESRLIIQKTACITDNPP